MVDQVVKMSCGEWFGQYFCELFQCVNMRKTDTIVLMKLLNMMNLDPCMLVAFQDLLI